MGESTRVCTKCTVEQSLDEFYRSKRGRDGRIAVCRACRKAYLAIYRAAHRVKARATTARYRADNPERVRLALEHYRADPANQAIARARAKAFRIANPQLRSEYDKRRRAWKKKSAVVGFITAEMLAAKAAYWGHRCWICGGEPNAWDHVKPLNKKGPHVLANLRPVCAPCNAAKKDRWPFPLAVG